MATEMFDPAQIDAAVGDALGVKIKPTARPAPATPTFNVQTNEGRNVAVDVRFPTAKEAAAPTMAQPKTPAPIRTNNPGALMPGGKLAEYGSMEEGLAALDKNLKGYKRKGINTLEGVISTWAPPNENDTKAYIAHVARVTGLDPKQSIDLDSPLVRQQLTAGIIQMESGRKAVFGHTGKADATPGQLSVDELMKPDAVNAAVADAFNEPPPTGKVASKVTQFLKNATDMGVSAFNQFQQGKRALGEIVATPIAGAAGAVLGPVAGVIESVQSGKFGTQEGIKAGEQKAAAVQQALMPELKTPQSRAVFGAIQKGMEASKLPPIIPELMGIAPAVAPATRQAIAPLREAAAELKIAPPKPTTLGGPGQATAPGVPVPPQAVPPAPGRVSAGAAATPDATIVRQALTSATEEFQKLYGNMPLDKANMPAVLRHLEADSLDVPVRLLKGQATGDVIQLSKEQNLRGSQPPLAYRIKEQNQLLADNLQKRRELTSPDVFTTKTIDSSEALIDAYKALDDTRNVQISAAYKALEDANGGQFPVDGQAIVRNADAMLAKKLKTNFVPPEIAADLKKFREGEPMTFEQFEALRTNLAAEGRKAARASDGNREFAVNLIREAMEDLPLKGEAAALKPVADKARNLAKARFDELKKDPAYKAAVTDAVPPDKYFNKFVINGINKNINTMIDTLGRDSLGHQHIKAGTINYLSDKAGIIDGKGNFSQANYNKAVKQLDDVKNFGAIFDPESQLKLRTLGNVAGYTQFQPRGSFVNNSNSVVGYLANKAEQAGNVVGLGKFGIPAGTIVRQKIQSSKEKKFAREALEPGAGSTLDEISRQGK
jgi:hypothetical protein